MKKCSLVLSILVISALLISCSNSSNRNSSSTDTTKKKDNVQRDTAAISAVANTSERGDDDVLESILGSLGLVKDSCEERFIVHRKLSNVTGLSVWVIPKLASDEDGSETYDGYVLLVNDSNKQIVNKYFGKSLWVSDAISLESIEIDSIAYKVQNNSFAFGVCARGAGHSKPNPYEGVEMSLFMPEGDSLRKILGDYPIYKYNGEWDMKCAGEYTANTKTFVVSSNMTNGFYDILVNSDIEITTQKNCDDDDIIKKKKGPRQILKYVGGEYK